MPVFKNTYKRYCDRKLKFVGKHLKKDDKILDAGCGDKNHPYVFLELSKNFKITGVDFDNSCNPKIIKGDISHLEFTDKSFDAVICLDVLEHISNWKKSFYELVRVAKKNVIISVPTTESKVFFRICQFLRKIVGVNNIIFAGHFRDYFPEDIINLSKEKGYSCRLNKIRFATPFFSHFLLKTKLRYGGIYIITKDKK